MVLCRLCFKVIGYLAQRGRRQQKVKDMTFDPTCDVICGLQIIFGSKFESTYLEVSNAPPPFPSATTGRN